jgi:hypothetical protein
MRGRVELVSGMSGRLVIIMSITPGKLAKLSSGVMAGLFVGIEEFNCRRDVSGSW